MIDKRLMKEIPEANPYIVKQVMLQWITMLCNTGFVMLIAYAIEEIFYVKISTFQLLMIAIICLLLMLIRAFVTKKTTYYSWKVTGIVKDKLRTMLYRKLLEQKNHYNTNITTSELVQLSVEGIDQLETYFGKYLPQFFYSMLAPITLFLIVMWMDLKSAIVLLVCVPLIPVSIVVIQKIAKRLLSKYWTAYAQLGDSFLENLQGLTTLKIYQSDAYKHEEMNKESENFRKITMRVLTMQLNSISVMDLVAYGGAAIGSIVAIAGFMKGDVSLFSVICIILLSSEFFIPLRMLGSFFHIAMNGLAASAKIFRVMDEEVSHGKELSWKDEAVDIRFEHLQFHYDEKRDILQDINMHIKEKEFVGIVGESGSGKSTLAKLIAGLAFPYGGSLKIQGMERYDLDDTSFYEHVMYVTHNTTILKGTVRENLQIARSQASDEDMIEALKKVQLWEYLQTQHGLETQLQENGSNFSGGQKQRLAIARAILKDCEVYIFDEATSNIDTESEEAILRVIHAMAHEKTIIMITHRLSCIETCDEIYVMQDGNMVEDGTHDMLMRKQGMYAKLYEKQKELEEFGGHQDEE